jgi:starch phosphorylase
MYKHAYFHQQIDQYGNQIEIYSELNLAHLPIRLVMNGENEPLLVSVPLLDHEVFLKIWEVKSGRVSLFLLDTTVDKNSDEDKDIIHSLYGGSRDTRIRQEIILGIGGIRALRKMGINPTIFHMNEGHSAFLGLERMTELMNEGMDYKTALRYVRTSTLFTTHTPIPAGNEAFEFDMMDKYFKNFWPELEISHEKFFDLGRNTNIHQHENFSLTILALNLSSQANGVSKLHGEVSRGMWQKVWPGIPTQEVPIGHITNGVHTFTWLHREMIRLFDKYMGLEWRDNIRDQNYWDKIFDIPNEVFWDIMKRMKDDMIDHLRRHYEWRIERYGENYGGYPATEDILRRNILTIGFARRFAPYKRALLIFRDLDRIKKIINDPQKPVQILFAGKAHPANDAGKDLIRRIVELSKTEDFRGKIVFVEGYHMNNARSLISGVDVWLNTPRRPLEASGTSGQKVPINGGVNLSVLDGWWLEGYNGQNGWAIGQDHHYDDHEQQDLDDCESLYNILQNEVVPLYYKQDQNGIPHGWIEKVKLSFHSTITQFSAHRMVWQYLQNYYMPALKRSEKYSQEEYRQLHQFSKWQNRVNRLWNKLELTIKDGTGLDEDRRVLSAGESREISLHIEAGGLSPSDLRVEVILERQDAYRGHQDMKVVPMGLVAENGEGKLEYRAHITAEKDGSYRFNCRVLPWHKDLYNQNETRLIKWLD